MPTLTQQLKSIAPPATTQEQTKTIYETKTEWADVVKALQTRLQKIAVLIDSKLQGIQTQPYVRADKFRPGTQEQLETIRDNLKKYRMKLRDNGKNEAKYLTLLIEPLSVAINPKTQVNENESKTLLGELYKMKDRHLELSEQTKFLQEGVKEGLPRSQMRWGLHDVLRSLVAVEGSVGKLR